MLPNKLDFLGNVSEASYMQDHKKPELKDSGFCGNFNKNKFVSPEFLAGSVEFPPLPVHLDTRAAENISVVFFLSCVSRIIWYI